MSQNIIEPLEGEQQIPGVATVKPTRSNTRQLVAVAALLLSVVAVLGYVLVRQFTHKPADGAEKVHQVAAIRVGKLEMPEAPKAADPPASATSSLKGKGVPEVDTGGPAEPIPLRDGSGSGGGKAAKVANPDDAPMFAEGSVPSDGHAGSQQRDNVAPAVSDARAALSSYQRQAGELMQQLQKLTGGTAGGASPLSPIQGSAPGQPTAAPAALFGTMERSATPTVQARMLGDRSMILPKGTLFTCSLKTRVVSATSGFVGCQVMRNVFSDDGRVMLVERGSHLDGEYRIVQIRPGLTRIPVLWTRVRTPTGVTVDLDSPATGQLGESGIGGYVDNRWGERIGAALLLSLADDVLQFAGASHNSGNNNGNTLVLPNTVAQGPKLAEKVLEATINIPPLMYQNQGGIVGVYVARDIDFSTVYELKPQ